MFNIQKSSQNSIWNENKKLLWLTIPILIGQLSTGVLTLTDSLMSAQAGTVDLAAVSLGGSWWMPISLFCLGIPLGLAPITAHLKGANLNNKIASTMINSVFPSMLICLIGMLILIFAPEKILSVIDVEPELKAKTGEYLFFISFALIPLTLLNILKNTAEALSITTPSMLIGIAIALLNIPVNWLFINGYGIIPALGAPGCGLSTSLVTWAGFFMMFAYVKKSKHFHNEAPFPLSKTIFCKEDIITVIKIGLPIGAASIIETFLLAFLGWALASLGSSIVAASQIASSVYGIAFMIPISMSNAVAIRVGQNLGSGSVSGARVSMLSGFIISACLVIPGMLIIYSARYPIISLFTSDPTVVSTAAGLFFFVLLYQTQDPFFGTGLGVLRGCKDTFTLMILNLCILWGIAIPVSWLVAMTTFTGAKHGVEGFWFVIVSCYYLMTILSIIRGMWLLRNTKKQKKVPSTTDEHNILNPKEQRILLSVQEEIFDSVNTQNIAIPVYCHSQTKIH